jgi:hypothetical protein
MWESVTQRRTGAALHLELYVSPPRPAANGRMTEDRG